MADIFISYSKPDRHKVVMLAAYLESEGWSVWWDENLSPGEPYRDEIMKQLSAARAVIVLWTPTSVKSEFVRAEAGRAKADGKLIPVKDTSLVYADIPIPFGEMHTENFAQHELIRAAIVAQLAKPQVQPGTLWWATKTLRYQALTWFGIVGGAITMFVSLQGLLTLAHWARWLVTSWQDVTSAMWSFLFSIVRLSLPREYAPILTFMLFGLSIAYGARRASVAGRDVSVVPRFAFIVLLAVFFLLYLGWISVGAHYLNYLLNTWDSHIYYNYSRSTYDQYRYYMGIADFVLYALHLIGWVAPFLILAILAKGNRSIALIFSLMFLAFYAILFLVPWSGSDRIIREGAYLGRDEFFGYQKPTTIALLIQNYITATLLYVIPTVMVLLAPLRSLVSRFSFLSFGVLLLIVLNFVALYAAEIKAVLKLGS